MPHDRYQVLSHLERKSSKLPRAAAPGAKTGNNGGGGDRDGMEVEDVEEASGGGEQGDVEHTSSKEWHLTMSTMDGGYNGGVTFVHRVPAEEGEAWKQRLEQAVSQAKEVEKERLLWLEHGHSVRAMMRIKTAILYESTRFQLLCACLIIFGFALDLMEASIMPAQDTDLYRFFFWMDVLLVERSERLERLLTCACSPAPAHLRRACSPAPPRAQPLEASRACRSPARGLGHKGL